jgi:hypothetical protein
VIRGFTTGDGMRIGLGTPFAPSGSRPIWSNAAVNNLATAAFNPLFLRHDLMIELGRLEMALDEARVESPAAEAVGQLETRRARINEALSKLPA